MNKEKVVVVGLGEVGRTLFDLLRESGKFDVYGFDIREEVMQKFGQTKPPSEVETMHICIPCVDTEEFAKATQNYAKQFCPKLIIINSTVIPGTTNEVFKRCGLPTAHSPTRGVHESPEHMLWEMKRWKKYVGGADAESGQKAKQHFEKSGLKTKVLKSCRETELAKLFETTYRAWMIACFQEMHRISRSVGADFDDTVDFLEDTHRVRLDRPYVSRSYRRPLPNPEHATTAKNLRLGPSARNSEVQRKTERRNQRQSCPERSGKGKK